MQTLNVGAGRTDADYKAAEAQRRADLRADSLSSANFFFWAAALAALGTGLLPIRIGLLINIGAVDLLTIYGSPLGQFLPLAVLATAASWLVILVALGFAARHGYRWAFLAGFVLYGADMLALMVTFSIYAFGVHAFFVYKWLQGYRALRDLEEPTASTS
jgi:hypothetical protein